MSTNKLIEISEKIAHELRDGLGSYESHATVVAATIQAKAINNLADAIREAFGKGQDEAK